MLTEAEGALLRLLKESALASRLRVIDTLPELAPDKLVQRLALDAPAIYVDTAPFAIGDRAGDLRLEVLLLARNARSPGVARSGDGIAIGLLQLIDAALSLIDGAVQDGYGWRCLSVAFERDAAFFAAGFLPASILVATRAELDPPIDETALADFETFHGDYDIDPHQPRTEHDKWLQEPPDHSGSQPELTDTVVLD